MPLVCNTSSNLYSYCIWALTNLYSYCIWAATWQNQQRDCTPSEDSDQPGHPPSLIRVFAVRMKKAWVLSYPLSVQRRRWSDWADAQADLSLRWAHSHFVGFVMSRLICFLPQEKVPALKIMTILILCGYAIEKCIEQKWAASWQNQQNDCAPSEDSDQPGHSHEETLGP